MACVWRAFTYHWGQWPSSLYPIGIPFLTWQPRCHKYDLMVFWYTWGCHSSPSPWRLLFDMFIWLDSLVEYLMIVLRQSIDPFHQRLCAHNQNLVKCMLPNLGYQFSNPVGDDVLRQLICRATSKCATWSSHYFTYKSKGIYQALD